MKYEKCQQCNNRYTTEKEELCTECAVIYTDEIENRDKNISEELSCSVSWDQMNDIGFSLTQRDWWNKSGKF